MEKQNNGVITDKNFKSNNFKINSNKCEVNDMARYIDADLEIGQLQAKCINCVNYDVCTSCYVDKIIDRFKKAPTADVVPRSEVEKFIQEIDQIQKDKAEVTYLKEQLIKKAKQEVAKQIFEEIEKHILEETTKSRTIIKDGVNRCFSDYLEGQIVMLHKIPVWIAELKKKYIGE